MSKRLRRFAVGGLWLATIALGIAGAGPEESTWLDRLYLTLQLFALNYSPHGPITAPLEIARFLAPLLTISAVLAAAAVLFRTQLRLTWLRLTGGHVIVCGLSDEGSRLAQSLAGAGRRVVVLDPDPAQAPPPGVTFLAADPRQPDSLRIAGVARADNLVGLLPDDGANAEVAAAARLVPRRTARPLRAFVHLLDPQLCFLLRRQEISDDRRGVQLGFFNMMESGARQWLSAHPADGPIVVVGAGRLGGSLVVAAVQRWTDAHPGERLRVTIVDRRATARVHTLGERHPSLLANSELVPVSVDLDGPEPEAAAALGAALRAPDLAAVFICLADEAQALAAGLLVHQARRDRSVPVVVRTRSEAGLATLLRDPDDGTLLVPGLAGFPLLDRTCTAELVEGGAAEQLARALHEEYMGRGTPGAYAVRWDDLPEDIRQSNRTAASDMVAGLTGLGCDLFPMASWDDGAFALTAAEVEPLAKREHERWRSERHAAGWRHGAVRDDAARRNPLLVPWEELDEATRDTNRARVRQLPELLARAGLGVVRIGSAKLS